MSDNDGNGWIVMRPGVPRSKPAEAGQLTATFRAPAGLHGSAAELQEHEHVHPVDSVGPERAAQFARDIAEAAEKHNVPAIWATDPQAVNAATILASKAREETSERLNCRCQLGSSTGVRPLLRSFIAEGRKWLVTSSYKIGNDEFGRVRVPPLAEPLPGPGVVHVTNLVTVCERCMQGLFVMPRQEGRVEVYELGAPIFGRIRE